MTRLSPMPITTARAPDLPVLRRLLRMGRFVYTGIAEEDLPAVVAKGMTLLAGEAAHPWGVMVVDPEQPRPASLPADAPDRAQVRALALRHGPWLDGAGALLIDGLRERLPDPGRRLLLSAYVNEQWLQAQLAEAGFALADTVVYFRLNGLADAAAPGSEAEGDRLPSGARIVLRPAALGETESIAAMDASTFEPLWHFGAPEIVEMLVRGRVQVALLEGKLAGYSALITGYGREAHLARLAVHPSAQGAGIGRALLLDAIRYAQGEGYSAMALNTQASNERSQALYRSAGFKPTGVRLAVYTLVLYGGNTG